MFPFTQGLGGEGGHIYVGGGVACRGHGTAVVRAQDGLRAAGAR